MPWCDNKTLLMPHEVATRGMASDAACDQTPCRASLTLFGLRADYNPIDTRSTPALRGADR